MKTAAYVICFVVGGQIGAITLFSLWHSSPGISMTQLVLGIGSGGLLALGDRLVRSQYRPRPMAALRASYLVGAVCAPPAYVSFSTPTFYSRSEILYTDIEFVGTEDSVVVEGGMTNVDVEPVE